MKEEILIEVIKSTINGEEHLGVNLKEQCIEYIDNLQQENQELKKQLEEKENIACNWKDSCLENAGKIEKLENQQNEFINYLTSYIELLNNKTDLIEESQKDILEETLLKFKKIIGVSK